MCCKPSNKFSHICPSSEKRVQFARSREENESLLSVWWFENLWVYCFWLYAKECVTTVWTQRQRSRCAKKIELQLAPVKPKTDAHEKKIEEWDMHDHDSLVQERPSSNPRNISFVESSSLLSHTDIITEMMSKETCNLPPQTVAQFK